MSRVGINREALQKVEPYLNVGLHGEWDQTDKCCTWSDKHYEEKDIRKAGLSEVYARNYKGYDPAIWITEEDTDEDKKLKEERQKKIDALPDKKIVHIDLELEKADCSGCYQLTSDSELALAKLLRKEKFNIVYASSEFLQALDYYAPIGEFNDRGVCLRINDWVPHSTYRSDFYRSWKKYIEEGDLPDMSELFTRLMSTAERKMILKKAAQEAGKELDESQLNLLASNQELAKAYVKPILDAMPPKMEEEEDDLEEVFTRSR